MDLSLVSIDDLIAEIDSRVTTSVLVTHKECTEGDSHDWHIHGNRITALGLLTLAIDHIRTDFEAKETGGFEED